MKVKMLQSQAGVDYSRNVGDVLEIPTPEADRMIKSGICEKFIEAKNADIVYKQKQKTIVNEYEEKIAFLKNEIIKLSKQNDILSEKNTILKKELANFSTKKPNEKKATPKGKKKN